MINNSLWERTMVICPHTDDEFGCAGTIDKIIRQGSEVVYVAFSRCEMSVPPAFPEDILEIECRRCLSYLGLDKEQVHIFGYPVRHFPASRQEILDDLVTLNHEYKPGLVLIPNSCDTHQDHQTIYEESFRAFKNCSILGYELPQNLIRFTNSAFVRLSTENIERKITALGHYKSQSFRPYSSAEFIKGLATVRGVQCAHDYAEAYEVIRLIC